MAYSLFGLPSSLETKTILFDGYELRLTKNETEKGESVVLLPKEKTSLSPQSI